MRRRTFVAGSAGAVMANAPPVQAQSPAWAPWKDLLNALPTAAAMNQARGARGRGAVAMKVQRIEDAKGQHVNFDLYTIDIRRMPTQGPKTGPDLLAYIRSHLGDFFDPNVSTLVGHTPGDADDWKKTGPAPRGSIMVFNIGVLGPIHEEAAVVTSVSESVRFVFTPVTIGTSSPGEHPVSGNREFGFRAAAGLQGQIYTRAADRALDDSVLAPSEKTVFDGADALWKSFQARVSAYLNQQGGDAAGSAPTIRRPDWSEIKASGLFERA